jgi:TonB family protein
MKIATCILALASIVALSSNVVAQTGSITNPSPSGSPHTCSEDQYPVSAMQLGAEGTTLVSFLITPQGDVTNVSVAKTSGNHDLDDVSIACVLQWHYWPATKNGTAVQAERQAAVKWEIQLKESSPIQKVKAAADSCLISTHLPHDELARAERRTVVRVRFAEGKIAGVSVAAPSGSSELDQRVVNCYEQVDPSIVAAVDGEHYMLFAANWNFIASKP